MNYWMSEPLKLKSTESIGVSLELQHTSESPVGLVKTQLSGSHLQNFGFSTFCGGGRGEKIAFLISVQIVLLLLVWEPCLGDVCLRLASDSLPCLHIRVNRKL